MRDGDRGRVFRKYQKFQDGTVWTMFSLFTGPPINCNDNASIQFWFYLFSANRANNKQIFLACNITAQAMSYG